MWLLELITEELHKNMWKHQRKFFSSIKDKTYKCEQKESLYTNVTQVHILYNKHLAHKHVFDLLTVHDKM